MSGSLQGLELRAFDRFLLNRASTPVDNRIVLINETEADIRRYGHPLPDQVLADALQALEKYGARVIGVDKYRDVAVAPGTKALNAVLQENSNIIWIFFAGNTPQEYISVPPVLVNNPERSGFNDLVEDSDGIARRGLLFLQVNSNNYHAFPLLLTLQYLAKDNIFAQSDIDGHLSLNGISLPQINSSFGAYNRIDANGYQIMLNYPGLPKPFMTFTLSDLLDKKISEPMLRDKLILIGSKSLSLHDYQMLPNEIKGFGIDYHAYFSSQLLNSSLNHQQPLRAWSNTIEYLWLGLWCLIGAFTGLRRDNLRRLFVLIAGELLILLICNQLFLNQGWWMPFIMPLLGWANALVVSVLYFFARERTERRQLMQLFACHVSPEVANRLWVAREQFFSEGGVRPDNLTATVLFTDLSNFTTVAETMEPLVLMRWLNQYMEEMSRIVSEHGGIINKYIGDAIMAVFGVPVKRELDADIADDAKHAVLCALNFNRRLRELNQQWQAQDLPTLTMRTGIQTGMLVAGSFGGSLRMEYTVIGDTVNTASRLESFDKTVAPPNSANPCRILIGETTYQYVLDSCEAVLIGECQLKGKHRQLKIYQIISPKTSE